MDTSTKNIIGGLLLFVAVWVVVNVVGIGIAYIITG